GRQLSEQLRLVLGPLVGFALLYRSRPPVITQAAVAGRQRLERRALLAPRPARQLSLIMAVVPMALEELFERQPAARDQPQIVSNGDLGHAAVPAEYREGLPRHSGHLGQLLDRLAQPRGHAPLP